jgi:hypothetical protein
MLHQGQNQCTTSYNNNNNNVNAKSTMNNAVVEYIANMLTDCWTYVEEYSGVKEIHEIKYSSSKYSCLILV